MNAYVPMTACAVLVVAACVGIDVGLGRWLLRLHAGVARSLAWVAVLVSVMALHFVLLSEPPGFRMLALVVVGLTGMKLVVVTQCRLEGKTSLTAAQWQRFALAWLGMRPEPFRVPRRPDVRAGRALLLAGLRSTLIGLLVLGAARTVAGSVHERIPMVLVLVGASLVLHFGFCSALAGVWRWKGVSVEPLFREPTRATSLTEFWGKRWNLAFSRMTQLAVYRPLSARLGRPVASVVAFMFSGALHEMAISLPVRAGYGGPLAYFGLQAVLVHLERLARDRGVAIEGRWGRAWTIAGLVLPMPWLFHGPFIRGVLLPVIGVN